MSCGRLEAYITVPTGGWTLTLTITAIGGPCTITMTAGAYTVTTFLAALKTALDAASGADGAFGVTINTTDRTGTGIVTITHATQTFTLVPGSTEMLGLLGMASMTPAALTFSGARPMRGVWLPDSDISSTYGDGDEGHTEIDAGRTVSPTGQVRGLAYATRVRQPWIRWANVTRARARTSAEAALGDSFETWWLDTHSGRYTYFGSSPKVIVYSDSDTSTVLGTYRLIDRRTTEMVQAAPPWNGLWSIEITGYKVPS